MIELQYRRRYLAFSSLNMRKVDWNSFLRALALSLPTAFFVWLREGVILFDLRALALLLREGAFSCFHALSLSNFARALFYLICALLLRLTIMRWRFFMVALSLFLLELRDSEGAFHFTITRGRCIPTFSFDWLSLPYPTWVELLFLYVWARACFQKSIPKSFHHINFLHNHISWQCVQKITLYSEEQASRAFAQSLHHFFSRFHP